MRKCFKENCVLSLRKKLITQTIVCVLIVAGIGIAGLMTGVEPRNEEFNLDKFLESLDLPQMAPYQASDGVLDGEGGYFGYSVSYAGDVNYDGEDDIIVGAPYYDNSKGRVYIFFGSDDTMPDATITGDANGDMFGASVSGAGNYYDTGLNPIDDVVIGAPGDGPDDEGMIYIFLGMTSGWGSIDYASQSNYEVAGENSDDEFGCSVSSAGDMSDDGYDEILVGAAGYSSDTGKVYMFYGDDDGDQDVWDVWWTGSSSGDRFAEVSSAGNVNGDDFDDIIIGALWASSQYGQAYIVFGSHDISSSPDVTITGESLSSRFGQSVSDAGNVNGDSYDDVIIGSEGAGSYGKAYIFNGRSSWSSSYSASSADVILVGETDLQNVGFGESVSSAGDYNNDGNDDVIVGSRYENALGGSQFDETGRAHIFFGGSSMDTKVDVSMTGEGDDDYFGFSVSNAGDFDGDGYYDDVVVGAPYNDDAGNNYGRAYVYNFVDLMEDTSLGLLGYSVSGVDAFNDDDSLPEILVGDPIYQVSSNEWGRAYLYEGGDPPDGADYEFTSEQINSKFGYSVASGDFNNDGYGDVVVGAPYYDDGATQDVGRVYVYLGDDDPDTTVDVVITGSNQGDLLGWSVASAGYWGGSSYEDLLIGAPGYNSNVGRAYLIYGAASWDSEYDAESETDLQFGSHVSDGKFGFSVSGAGDMDNNVATAEELIIGAPLYDDGMPKVDAGRVYVYSGDDADPTTAEATYTGETAGDQFGFSVSGAGNMDNDYYDDIIVGAPEYSSSKGRAYIFLGQHTLSGDTDADSADEIMTGESNSDDFGYSVSGAGDVNGDGYDDVVIGAPLNDMGGTDAGRVYIYYGDSTLNDWDDVFITGMYANSAGEKKGWAVSGLGDVNGDGYDDIAIGAPYRMGTASPITPEGKVEVWGSPKVS